MKIKAILCSVFSFSGEEKKENEDLIECDWLSILWLYRQLTWFSNSWNNTKNNHYKILYLNFDNINHEICISVYWLYSSESKPRSKRNKKKIYTEIGQCFSVWTDEICIETSGQYSTIFCGIILWASYLNNTLDCCLRVQSCGMIR